MFFAAKEAVENRAMERGRQVGRQEGIQEGMEKGIQEGREKGVQEGRDAERERISKTLAQYGVPLTPEQVKVLSGELDKS